MTELQGSAYIMGKTQEEYQRLRRQAQVLERFTVSILDRLGVAKGMGCLDVGCGPGGRHAVDGRTGRSNGQGGGP